MNYKLANELDNLLFLMGGDSMVIENPDVNSLKDTSYGLDCANNPFITGIAYGYYLAQKNYTAEEIKKLQSDTATAVRYKQTSDGFIFY